MTHTAWFKYKLCDQTAVRIMG